MASSSNDPINPESAAGAPDESGISIDVRAGAAADVTAPPASLDESTPDADGSDQAMQADPALLGNIEQIAAERDDYLDALQRLKADFDNYRKRVLKQSAEAQEAGAEKTVLQLLPVLDTLELAVAHGEGGVVEQVAVQMIDVLQKGGLERLHPLNQRFNPAEHEAVAHDPAEEGDTDPIVSEVFRTGYRWKARVIRAAMVKVRG